MTEKIQNNKKTLIIIGILLVIGFLFLYSSKGNEATPTNDVPAELDTASSSEDTISEEVDTVGADMSETDGQLANTADLPALDLGDFNEKGGDIAEISNVSDIPPPDPDSFPEPESIALSPDEYPELYDGTAESATNLSQVGVLLTELQSLQVQINILLSNDTSVIQDDLPTLIAALEALIEDLNSYVSQLAELESEM